MTLCDLIGLSLSLCFLDRVDVVADVAFDFEFGLPRLLFVPTTSFSTNSASVGWTNMDVPLKCKTGGIVADFISGSMSA